MAKRFNALDGFTLRDLTVDDGMIFEIGDEYNDAEEEEFAFSNDVHLSNAEALNLLNMDDFEDEDDKETNGEDTVTLCGIGFEKLKTRMTDILGNGKVMKLVKHIGVGEVIPRDAQVNIKYVGYLEYRDEPFDSSFARAGVETFRLGQGAMLPGLELGIATMRKHEQSVFVIHPDLAFGRFGCAPRIPPNEEVMFIVHLVDFLDNGSADTFENLSTEERRLFVNIVMRVQAVLNTAKDRFKKQKTKQAIREYEKAVRWLENAELRNQEDEDNAHKLLSRACNNLAVCYNKENMPRRACIACNKVPTPTAKTYFNRGRALLRIGEYDRAMQELQTSHKMEPNNKEIVKEIRLANEKLRKYSEVEKRLWRNCLNAEQNEKQESSFQKVAREMCETFVQDNRHLRQPLPEILTPEEEKYIREQAAALGLSITTHQRNGKQVVYLNKPGY